MLQMCILIQVLRPLIRLCSNFPILKPPPSQILEAALLASMLVVRGNYQSTMNSKLTAPPTSAIPFYHQDGLIGMFNRSIVIHTH